MAYERINWQNEPSEATALNDVNLNKMDSAIYELDGKATTTETAITNLQNGKVDKVIGQGLSKTNDVQVASSTNVGTEIATVQIFPSTGGVSGVQIKNGVVVDSALSSSSENPVQNKVVNTALENKVDKESGKGLSYIDVISVTRDTPKGSQIGSINIVYKNGNYESNPLYNGIEVDSSLDGTSENPVQNKVVKSAIDEKSTVAISDTLATGTTLANITIDGTTTAIKGSDIEVDEELSPTSTNPVENKAIYDALNNLLPSKTVSGNPISISDASGFDAKALKVTMNPIQDLHGYDNPWAGGAGKNKFQNTATTQTINGVTFTVNSDGTVLVNGTATGGDSRFTVGAYIAKAQSSQKLNGLPDSITNSNIVLGYQGYGIVNTVSRELNISRSAETDWNNDVYITVKDGITANNLVFKPMIRLSTETDPTFEPYSNICPISGRTETSVTRTAGEDVETKTHQYSETICGGVDDYVNGGLTNEWGYIASYNGETLPGEWISDRDEYQAGATPTTGAEVAYKLATPTTISTSAEEITLLKGNNVLISTNADDMELKYSVSLDSLLPTTTRTLAKSPIAEEPKEETDETEEQR